MKDKQLYTKNEKTGRYEKYTPEVPKYDNALYRKVGKIMNLTKVYLEIASCIYLSIILFFYLKKKKVDTIENRIFTAVIITGVLVCFFDAVSTTSSSIMQLPAILTPISVGDLYGDSP